jgi:hypothetical protein
MHTNLWFWIAFNAGVLCVLAIDLFGFQRKAHAPSTKESAIWTAVWVALFARVQCTDLVLGGTRESVGVPNRLSGGILSFGRQHLRFRVVHKFVYLKPALAIILSFIGAKMLLANIYHIQRQPHWALLAWFYWPRSVCRYSQTVNVQRLQSLLGKLTIIHHPLPIYDDN